MRYDNLLTLEASLGPAVRLAIGVTLLMLASLLLSLALRRASAAVRHRIWSLGILSVLLLPPALLVCPEWQLGWLSAVDHSPAAREPVASRPVGRLQKPPHEEAVVEPVAADESHLVGAETAETLIPSVAIPHGTAEQSNITASDQPSRPPASAATFGNDALTPPAVARKWNWVLPMTCVWAAGVLVALLRIAFSLMAACRLIEKAAEVDDPTCLSSRDEIAGFFSLKRLPRVLESAETVSPLCIGLRRSDIVLPLQWRTWSADELNAALSHELAHVSRRDLGWQLLAQLACAIYWPHPLVWLAAWRMRVEREIACDDCVLQAGQRPSLYARLLLNLAETVARHRSPRPSNSVAMAWSRHVEQRIRAVLDPHAYRMAVGRRLGWSLAVGAAALVLLTAAISPLSSLTASQPSEKTAAKSSADKPAPEANPEAASRTERAASDAAESDAPSNVQVAGRVVDESDGAVAGAMVTALAHKTAITAETDSDGTFQIDLPSEKLLSGLTLRASHKGGTLQGSFQFSYDTQESPTGPTVIKLLPAREIAASVFDEGKRPLADVRVIAVANHKKFAEAVTDASGRVLLQIPRQASLQYVFAFEPNVGLDYFVYRRSGAPKNDPYQLDQDHAEPLNFVLNGTHDLKVRVLDSKDRPLQDVLVYPWYFEKPHKGDHLNVSGLEEFQTRTNAEGLATIRSIPKDNSARVTIWAHEEGYFAPERWMFDPAAPAAEIIARLVPLVPVTGRVTYPDGRPAAGIDVLAAGEGYTFDDFRAVARTQDDGTFELKVAPDQYYLFVAGNDEWAASERTGIVYPDKPIHGVEFQLQPASRIHGRVTIGPEHKPLPKQHLVLYQRPTENYYELPEKDQLPNPKDSRKAVSPILGRTTYTDEQGRFEFLVGPGNYYIIGPDGSKPPKFVITDQQSLEVNLHASYPDVVRTSGRVVRQDDAGHGVAKAVVRGVPQSFFGGHLEAVADAEGRFEADRGGSRMVVFARTADRRLAGIVEIGPEDEQVVIPVGPTASARGRLLDQLTSEPLPGEEISYGVTVHNDDGTFSTNFGGSVTTDTTGAFTITGLVVGREYDASVVTDRDSEGRPRSWRKLIAVKSERPERIQLGDVKLSPPYRPPTLDQRIARLFGESPATKQRLQAKLRDARLGHQRVLVVLAAPGSVACRDVLAQYFEGENAVREAFAHYVVLAVDPATAEQAAEMLSLEKEAEELALPGADGVTLGVLHGDGRLVAQATEQQLGSKDGLDQEKLVAFLRQHVPELPDAEEILSEALRQATRENKRVLLQHSGAYCGPCVLLSRFLDEHRELIAKDYIYITIDERFRSGSDVIRRFRQKDERGIPWMVILDGGGAPLITSDGPEGNIGYPGGSDGAKHFEEMLRTTAVRLSEPEIRSLLRALVAAQTPDGE